jgi:ADP-ribosylglycohydrolase
MNYSQKKQAAVLGSLVGDAASLGFHWLYDPKKIVEIGGERPEFHQPNETDYRDASGYFAADGKKAGEQSHYGAQLEVALRSLVECEGEWNPFHYQASFCQAFDRGGWFSGYIDSATKGTLERVKRSDENLLEKALSQVAGLTDSQKSFFKKYVVQKGLRLRGEALVEAIEGMTTLIYKDPEIVAKGRTITEFYDQNRKADNGADDNQLPAMAKLPVVVAQFAGKKELRSVAEVAIRVTNDNEDAVVYGLFAADVLERVLLGSTVRKALAEALGRVEDDGAKKKLEQAMQESVDDLGALGRVFGPACPMTSAIPVGTALLKKEPDYASGIRQNILVSGDNAGRAIYVGAVLGAAHGLGGDKGIPLSWLARLEKLRDYLQLVTIF